MVISFSEGVPKRFDLTVKTVTQLPLSARLRRNAGEF